MNETYEYEELAWVPLSEWPLEDDASGQDIANTLAPDQCEWVRKESLEPGYSLMKYKGEYGDE